MQRVKTEKNPRALLGPAAAGAAQEQQRAANRPVKASALPPGFALDKRWRSTLSPTTSEPGFSLLSYASMLGRPPGLIHGTAPLDAGGRHNDADHVLASSSPSSWMVGATDMIGATTRARHRDMASKTLAAVRWALSNLPRPMSRSFPSTIACLQDWKRLEPRASRPPAPRELVLLVARWLCRAQPKKLPSLCFCLLFEMYMRPSEGLELRASGH